MDLRAYNDYLEEVEDMRKFLLIVSLDFQNASFKKIFACFKENCFPLQ